MNKKLYKLLVLCMTIFLLGACGNSNPDSVVSPKESSIYQVAEVEDCRITKDNTAVKSGAGENNDTISNLNKGDEVKVLGKIEDWYVIQLDNYQVGCINTANTTPIVKENQQPEEPITQNPPQTNQPQTNQPEASNPPTESAVSGLTDLEAEMLRLINAERAKNSIQALEADLELTRVARIKSQDMIDNNYFSHYSPNYGSPFEMMRSFGIDYLYAGENIAANSTVQKAHDALMNSSGHRKNILNPNYTHIGLGIKSNDRTGYMFTQMFIGKPQ